MSFKEFIKDMFDRAYGFSAQIGECRKTSEYYQERYSSALTQIDELNSELKALRNKEIVNNHPRKIYWDNRKPMADIFYRGRPYPLSPREMLEMDVRLFITPRDRVIQNNVRNYNLLVKDPLKCDDDMLKIYRWHQQKYFSYAYDEQTFKIPELWLFPYEMMAKRKGDCEDYTHSLISHMIAAGVPSWRLRAVCGLTWEDFGHSTFYPLSDDLVTWRHMNSTTPISMIPRTFNELPKSNDSSDKIGIKDVWFSFNDYGAWHTFETGVAENSFKKNLKNVRIIPRR